MTNGMAADLLWAAAESLKYAGYKLQNVAEKYQSETTEPEEKSVEKPVERHTIADIYNHGEMSIRLANILRRRIYFTDRELCIEDLGDYTERAIKRFRNIGDKTMGELRPIMEKYGVKFKEDGT